MSDDLFLSLAQDFARFFAGAVESMTGASPETQARIGPDFRLEEHLLWRQPLQSLPGAAWVAAADSDWRSLASAVLKAGVNDSDDATLRSTFLETIRQALAGLAQAISTRANDEFACSGGELTGEAPRSARWAVIDVAASGNTTQFTLGMDEDLLQAVRQRSIAAPSPAQGTPLVDLPKSKTFDLLLEVELPVSVSFGRAQVQLKDVLKLTTGSIVELNRSITEPVEVIVNNCVIARGEVVVVDGNFGVRIQHVISRQERLRTLY